MKKEDMKKGAAPTPFRKNLICLSEGAIMVALALALSPLKLKLFPTGGSVDLVMIPLLVFALRRGAIWGVGAGLIFGTLKCMLSEGIAYGWQALILDYSVAYGVTGLAGLIKSRPVGAVALGSLLRYVVHVISGVVIWHEYMPEEFLGLSMNSVWIYSIIYNATFVLPSAAIVMVSVALINRRSSLLRPS